MKQEILRLDNVTYMEHGIAFLEKMNFQIFRGEIKGLLPINTAGVDALIRVIQSNLPLHFGQVYFHDQLVNHHRYTQKTTNAVMVIGQTNGLLENLSVLENVCVFGKRNHPNILSQKRNLELYLALQGRWNVNINPRQLVKDLSLFQRLIVSLMNASIAWYDLIIVQEISHILTHGELEKIREIMGYMTQKGQSFLYICSIQTQLSALCQQVSLMQNGRILKTVDGDKLTSQLVELVSQQVVRHDTAPSSVVSQISQPVLPDPYVGLICGISFQVYGGQCLEILCESKAFLHNFLDCLTAWHPQPPGFLQIGEKCHTRYLLSVRDIFYISNIPYQKLLFANYDSLDNLFFRVDTRLMWGNKLERLRQSIACEYAAELGDIPHKKISDLTIFEKYTLIFHRIMLQKPKLVFYQQPFWGTDIHLRQHILVLTEKLLKQGIAVVVLSLKTELPFPLANNQISNKPNCRDCNEHPHVNQTKTGSI